MWVTGGIGCFKKRSNPPVRLRSDLGRRMSLVVHEAKLGSRHFLAYHASVSPKPNELNNQMLSSASFLGNIKLLHPGS